MQNIYNKIILLLDGIEAKISFTSFAVYMSYNFGASEYLLLMVQYLFVTDFFIGILDATKTKKFSWSRVWQGFKKITSLYFSVLVVGFGTKAFDVALRGRIEIEYNGAFIFDIFILLLIIFELASINRHLARLGFIINKHLETVFNKLTRKLKIRLNKTLDEAIDKTLDSIDEKQNKNNKK